MEKVMKDKNKMKRQYVSPSFVEIGSIGIKTLGNMEYMYDKFSGTCQDRGAASGDACHQEYYS